jgi:hypothetical protein
MKTLQDFFLFCSGADASIMEQCPTDRHKYAGIGATVFFTGVLAFCSSGYALYTVFDAWLPAVAFGLVWGLMIFNLDRYIVMSMKSQGRWWRDALVALPRLVMAVLLALVISKPLELKIFEKEVHAEVLQMEQEVYRLQETRVRERYQAQMDNLRGQVASLKSELGQKAAARDSLARAAVQEADGTGGSRQRNLGPIYRTKQAAAAQAQTELDRLTALYQPQIQEKEAELQRLETTVTGEIAALDRDRYDGLAARLDALARLTAKSAAIFYASIFITLLFAAIECAPVLVKLISYRSPYDFVLHQQEHVFEMANLEQTTLLGNAVQTKLKYDTETGAYRVNADIAAEKAVIDQKLKTTLERLKNQEYDWETAKR